MDFLKNHKKFDLFYEKKSIWDSETTCEICENEKELISVYTVEDRLKITNIARKYE